MIYLVTNQKQLFNDNLYKIVSPQFAINKINSLPVNPKYKAKILGADTETEGLNFLTKKILTIQLGIYDWQIVWDCTSVPIHLLKTILEDKNIKTIWWNYLFDGLFLYKEGIIPRNVCDCMINEKLLYLGISYKERLLEIFDTYGHDYTPYSLKTGVKKYCNVELDKSVRGKIIRVGITPDTIIYAANDVKYEPMLLDKQMEALEKKNIVKAANFENLFIRSLVYYKFCGVKLDVPRWKVKMEKDKKEMNIQIDKLNTWIYNFYNKHKVANNWIRLEIDVNRRTLGKEESLFKVPEYFIPIKGRNIERVDDDGVAWRYDVGTYDIPFGWIKGKPEYINKLINSCKNKTIKEFNILLRKNFKPYIGKDVQLDLFSEANTEEHCIINWSSPSSIVPLFELLGFNVLTFDKKTKKEKKSVSEKIITPQIKVCPEFANPYINYKKAFKVVSSYGQNWIDQIDVDGRIHPEYNQLGTATARVSSGKGNDDNDSEEDKDDKSINIQNLPRDSETRACFISEKGNSWISEDYQSQESQIMASVTSDPAMLKFYREGGGDKMYVSHYRNVMLKIAKNR